MRRPRLRFTVRRMMIAVALAAIGLRLGETTWRVWQDKDPKIYQLWHDPAKPYVTLEGHAQPQSFWSRDRCALLGQAWPGDFRCDCRSQRASRTRNPTS